MKVWGLKQTISQSYWFWYGVGVLFALLSSIFQQGPGYMDAAYYTVGGLQLFEGKGFFEPYIWNYLSAPAGIPAPAFVYWMPMPSIIAFLGMWITQSSGFFGAKLLFIMLSGFIPVLTVYTAKRLLRKPNYAWIAGGIAAIPGIYSIYLAIPESFVLYMLAGALFIIVAFYSEHRLFGSWESPQRFFVLGMIAGGMHLTRADGLVWLLAALGLLVWRIRAWHSLEKLRVAISVTGILLAGYFLLMGWWYFRNWEVFGTLFPPGNSKGLWLTSYNELYSYPSDHLTFQYWLKSGWSAILQARLTALTMNLQNFLAVQGSVVLTPLILLGIWSKRSNVVVKFGVLMWGVTFVIMTVVFPFAGSRGGFLHSGAATQILFWSLSIVGLEESILWLKKVRGWNVTSTMNVFGSFLVLVNLGIAVWIFDQRVIGNDHNLIWNQSIERYQRISEKLGELGMSIEAVGIVNNPPGYYWATRRSSIVIPDGDITHTIAVAERYGASYLLLEENQENLLDLYQSPEDIGNVRYMGTWHGIRIFKIVSTINQ
jgi:hypothetical protein